MTEQENPERLGTVLTEMALSLQGHFLDVLDKAQIRLARLRKTPSEPAFALKKHERWLKGIQEQNEWRRGFFYKEINGGAWELVTNTRIGYKKTPPKNLPPAS